MDRADHEAALLNWLSGGVPGIRNIEDLCAETGRRIGAAIESVDQFSIYATTIHPEIPGSYCYCTPGGKARLLSFNAEQLASDVWMGCPAQHCCERGRFIDHKLHELPEYEHRAETKLLIRNGFKQVFYIPLLSNYTLINNAASFGSRSEFTADEKRFFRMMQGPLARVVEAIVLNDGTQQILSTYVGRNAGNKVLQGNILRGDVENIPSIVLFLDLCDYTKMSNSLPPRDMINRLNAFLDAAGTIVEDGGGEILKFLGDGVLAIFPTPDDLSAQTAAAITAATSLQLLQKQIKRGPYPELKFRAALDIGDVFYGNIGSKRRMDFTAIGPVVNRAARLLDLASQLDSEYVCSDDFRHLLPGHAETLGKHVFKGFEGDQEIFRLIP